MNQRKTVIALAGLAAGLGDLEDDDAAGADDEDAAETGGAPLADEATLSQEAAVRAASARAAGEVTAVELEREGGIVLYSIAFDSGSEVEVDARTGAILEVETGDGD